MADRTDFGQVNWSLKDDHAEDRKRRLDDVWKHIRPLDDKPINGPKCPTSSSTLENLTRMGYDISKMGFSYSGGTVYDEDGNSCPTREMEKVSIGPIPESEEQNARNWYDVYRRLNEIGRRLDPRLSHDNRTPYDPIDLAFRIDQAVHAIDKLKSEISSRFNFVEPTIDHWTDFNV